VFLKPGVYGGTPIPQDRAGYAVVAPGARFGPWFAVRWRDGRVMAQANDPVAVSHEVAVWGPVWDTHRR
jgi:hypothetical protein